MLDAALMQMMERIAALERTLDQRRVEVSPSGAWTAFTPGFAQSTTITKTVNYARYQKIGRVAFLQIMVTSTGAGTVSNVVELNGIPAVVAPLQVGSGPITNGSAIFGDISANKYYNFGVVPISSTTLYLMGWTVGHYLGIDPAITIASGDLLAVDCSYETAT